MSNSFRSLTIYSIPIVLIEMSAVLVLLGVCRPTAIPGFVIAFIVNAVEGVTRAWPWAHVSKERGEGMQPFLAYTNATTTVTSKGLASRIATTVFHALPHAKFGFLTHSMNEVELTHYFALPLKVLRAFHPNLLWHTHSVSIDVQLR